MQILIFLLAALSTLLSGNVDAQTTARKVRMGIQSNPIGFLPFHAAYHKGFHRDQGIDVVREDSKVSQPFTVSQVVDYSFLDRARRDLGVNRQ